MQTLQKILPKYSIAIAVLFLLTVGYLITRGNTVNVDARKVTRAELVEAIYATGYIEAERVAALRSELSGTVLSVSALEGQQVKKGQPIIVFDSRQPRLAAQEAQAAIAEQRALFRDNSLRLSRNRVLFREGAISRQQFEEAEKNSIQSGEVLRQREMQLKSREDDLRKLTVTAPFDGILTLQPVKPGDYITLNTPVATVTDTSGYIITVEVDELDIPRLKTGQQAVIALDALPEKRFSAVVARIVPQTDRVTKTSKVYLRFTRSAGLIQAGMTATANIIYNTKKSALLVRKSSVFEEGRQSYVWKIDKGRLKKQHVRTGESDLTYIEIVSGIAAGDLVVVTPEEKFREGMEAKTAAEGKG
jgi:RND family efflux transporter MFP subunit